MLKINFLNLTGKSQYLKNCLFVKKVNYSSTTIDNLTTTTAAEEDYNLVRSYREIPGPKPIPFLGNTWRFIPYIGNKNIFIQCVKLSTLSTYSIYLKV